MKIYSLRPAILAGGLVRPGMEVIPY
jgi:hypothetical protein